MMEKERCNHHVKLLDHMVITCNSPNFGGFEAHSGVAGHLLELTQLGVMLQYLAYSGQPFQFSTGTATGATTL